MYERGQARHADQLLTVKTAVSLIFRGVCQELEARRMVSGIVRQSETNHGWLQAMKCYVKVETRGRNRR